MKKEKDYQETPENQAENGAAENAAEESEEAAVSPEEEKIAALTAETEALKASVSEYKDKWIRSVAEFDNYKKRTATVWTGRSRWNWMKRRRTGSVSFVKNSLLF